MCETRLIDEIMQRSDVRECKIRAIVWSRHWLQTTFGAQSRDAMPCVATQTPHAAETWIHRGFIWREAGDCIACLLFDGLIYDWSDSVYHVSVPRHWKESAVNLDQTVRFKNRLCLLVASVWLIRAGSQMGHRWLKHSNQLVDNNW